MALSLYDLTCEYQVSALGVARQNAAFGWKLKSDRNGACQTAYRLVIRDEAQTVAWDSGKVFSSRQFGVEKDGGTPLRPMEEYTFSVTVWDEEDMPCQTVTSRFVTGVLRVHDWLGQWFRVWHHGTVQFYRHLFSVTDASPIRYAYAYVASVGDKMNAGMAYLNGQRLGESVLFPGATEYFRALYTCVDVKELLQSGVNVICLVAAKTSSFMMKIAYEDGSVQYVNAARDTWRCAVQGPYDKLAYEESMQHGKGEEYDARKAYSGWLLPDFDDSKWETGERRLTIDFGPLFIEPQYV